MHVHPDLRLQCFNWQPVTVGSLSLTHTHIHKHIHMHAHASRSALTMFQLATGDGWLTDVVRPLMEKVKQPYISPSTPHIDLYIVRRALFLRKRAIYLNKKFLYICKTALYIRKRAIHDRRRALHTCKRALYRRWKSPMYLQKGPISPEP